MTVSQILRYFGFGEEATFGSEAVVAQHVDIASGSLDVPANAETIVPSSMGRGQTRKKPVYYAPSGNVVYIFDIRTILRPLKWALGGYRYTGSGGMYKFGTATETVGGASTTVKANTPITAGATSFSVTAATGIGPADLLRIGSLGAHNMEYVEVSHNVTTTVTIEGTFKFNHAAGEEVVQVDQSYSAKAGGASTTVKALSPISIHAATFSVTSPTGIGDGDTLKVGTGAGAEYVVVSGSPVSDVVTVYDEFKKTHAAADPVVEQELGGPDETELALHEIWGSNNVLLPSFTARLGKDAFEQVFLGATIDTLDLAMTGDLAQATIGMMAKKDKSTALLAVSDLILPTEYPLAFYETYAELGAYGGAGADISADVIGISANIKNNLQVNQGKSIGDRFPARIPAGARDMGFSATLYFEDDTYLQQFWGGSTGPGPDGAEFKNFSIWFATSEGYIQFYYPKVFIQSIKIQPSGRNPIQQAITWKALTDNVTLKDGVTVVATELLVRAYSSEADLT